MRLQRASPPAATSTAYGPKHSHAAGQNPRWSLTLSTSTGSAGLFGSENIGSSRWSFINSSGFRLLACVSLVALLLAFVHHSPMFVVSQDAERMRQAEASYQENLLQRTLTMEARNMSMGESITGFNRHTFEEILLAPLYPCPLQRHFGDWGEGGKWVCEAHGPIPESAIFFSMGTNFVIGFERDVFKAYHIRTFTFDEKLTERKMELMSKMDFLKFFPIGLNNVTEMVDGSPKLMDIHSLMKLAGHKFVDVLKVDCEGCEYDVFPALARDVDRGSPLFGQIILEIHQLDDVPRAIRLLRALEEMGYRMFHAEPNTKSRRAYEVAYIHESSVLVPRKL